MEFDGPVSPQEATIPNSMHLPPDPQPPSNFPLDYFTYGAPGETPRSFLLDMWTTDSTVLSSGGLDSMEWAGVFGKLPSSPSSY